MGAVSHAVGVEGSTYTTGDKSYELTGWTLGAIAAHERYLALRAEESLAKMTLTAEQRAEALALLAERQASFRYSYGGEIFTNSLKSFGGLGHFFWQLAKVKTPALKLHEAVSMVQADPAGVSQAVHEADPQNRATAEAAPKDADTATAS
jgi:hypothetical protein